MLLKAKKNQVFNFLQRKYLSVELYSNINRLILLEDLQHGVFCLTLSRKEGKNAFSKEMLLEFNNHMDTFHSKLNKECKVLIVKSSIDKVFCAGADLKERLIMPNHEVGSFVSQLRNSFQRLASLPFPTIAAIEGAALGGGLELALACDLRIAGSDALLGLPETSLAIIPGAGGTQRLSRIVGVAKAKELIFTSAKLTSRQSYEIGLINESVPAGTAYEKAFEMALVIASKGPIAQRQAKKAIEQGVETSIENGLDIERTCYEEVIHSEDRLEGLNSFIEKRKPSYKGK
eukprot:gene12730-17071_t